MVSRELRVFGTWPALYEDLDVFLDRMRKGTLYERQLEWRDDSGDKVKWLVVTPEDDGMWKQQIMGLEFSHVSIHYSIGSHRNTKEGCDFFKDVVHYCMSRCRWAFSR